MTPEPQLATGVIIKSEPQHVVEQEEFRSPDPVAELDESIASDPGPSLVIASVASISQEHLKKSPSHYSCLDQEDDPMDEVVDTFAFPVNQSDVGHDEERDHYHVAEAGPLEERINGHTDDEHADDMYEGPLQDPAIEFVVPDEDMEEYSYHSDMTDDPFADPFDDKKLKAKKEKLQKALDENRRQSGRRIARPLKYFLTKGEEIAVRTAMQHEKLLEKQKRKAEKEAKRKALEMENGQKEEGEAEEAEEDTEDDAEDAEEEEEDEESEEEEEEAEEDDAPEVKHRMKKIKLEPQETSEAEEEEEQEQPIDGEYQEPQQAVFELKPRIKRPHKGCVRKRLEKEKQQSQLRKELEEYRFKYDQWGMKMDDLIRRFFPILSCKFCEDKFPTFRMLRIHVAKKHLLEESWFSCCGKDYLTRSDLFSHIQYHVSPTREHACKTCLMSFESKFKFDRHHTESHTETVSCDQCDLRFGSKFQLYSHNITHLPVWTTGCPKCGIVFYTHKDLEFHFKIIHPGQPLLFECKTCQFKVGSQIRLVLHENRAHQLHLDKLICLHCGTKHPSISSFNHHQKRIAKYGYDGLDCPDCDLIFHDLKQLRTHDMNVHKTEL